MMQAEKLFDAILASPSGVVFAVDDYDEGWARVMTPNGKLQLSNPEVLGELSTLRNADPGTGESVRVLLDPGDAAR